MNNEEPCRGAACCALPESHALPEIHAPSDSHAPCDTDALTAQASRLVDGLRLERLYDGQPAPTLGVTEKQVWALCGAALVAALLALVGEVRALRLALGDGRLPRQP